jgi:hypothetical protein
MMMSDSDNIFNRMKLPVEVTLYELKQYMIATPQMKNVMLNISCINDSSYDFVFETSRDNKMTIKKGQNFIYNSSFDQLKFHEELNTLNTSNGTSSNDYVWVSVEVFVTIDNEYIEKRVYYIIVSVQSIIYEFYNFMMGINKETLVFGKLARVCDHDNVLMGENINTLTVVLQKLPIEKETTKKQNNKTTTNETKKTIHNNHVLDDFFSS